MQLGTAMHGKREAQAALEATARAEKRQGPFSSPVFKTVSFFMTGADITCVSVAKEFTIIRCAITTLLTAVEEADQILCPWAIVPHTAFLKLAQKNLRILSQCRQLVLVLLERITRVETFRATPSCVFPYKHQL